mgnify:FL=1
MAKKSTTEKQIVQRYTAGLSVHEVSEEFGLSTDAIRRVLKQHDVILHKTPAGKKKGPLDEKIAEKIIHDYVAEKKSIYFLRQKYHLSQDRVERCLKTHGVKKRTYVEAKQLSRVYDLNDDFFKEQTPNMAYILGLLASDGNISKNENGIFIELEKTDLPLLEDIEKITGNTRPIKFYVHDHHNGTVTEAAKFQAWSAEWKQDLAVYGITPEKTFSLTPPMRLKKELYIYYLKGYFDGDGSFSVKTAAETDGMISFIGTSKEVVEWMRDVLVNQYGIMTGKIQIRTLQSGHKFYHFCIYSHDSIRWLYHLWYDDPSVLSMQRKKDKMTTFINKIDGTRL